MSSIQLDISNLNCGACVARVESVLKGAPGVVDVSVNLVTQRAMIDYQSNTIDPAALAQLATDAGYPAEPLHPKTASTDQSRKDEAVSVLRRDVFLAIALTLPVFIVEMGGHLIPSLHHALIATIGQNWLWGAQFCLTTLVLVGPGRRFFITGLPALLRGAPEMNALVALGTLAAWSYSTLVLIAPSLLPEAGRAVYFEAASVIVTLILTGRYLELRARGKSTAAIQRLAGLQPRRAQVLREGQVTTIPIASVQVDDILVVRPGERVPTDGEIVRGHAFIDEAMLTGEAMPVEKTPGSAVTGGTVNGDIAFDMRATRVGAETVLAQIIRMVEEAHATKLPIETLVDRVISVFVPVILVLATLSVAIWLIFGPAGASAYALVAGVCVLIIACPCAMGLATPMSIVVSTGRAAELGVLFRRGAALQNLADVSHVAFDKTGTLTEGRPEIVRKVILSGVDEAEIMTQIAAAEAKSEHPIARAIEKAARVYSGQRPAIERVRTLPGKGVEAEIAGRKLLVGTADYLTENGVNITEVNDELERAGLDGNTPVLVAREGRLAAMLCLADPIKPTARASVEALHKAGVKTALISGDTKPAADCVARQLGIETVFAQVLPRDKVRSIDALRKTAGKIAFVGDGINDAPALAHADIGLAMGTGTDIAMETADIVLNTGDPMGAARAVKISRATMRNIRQNLFWAFAYNSALIPVAAGVLYPFTGHMLSPMLAAFAMALSSLCVVGNALRLRSLDP